MSCEKYEMQISPYIDNELSEEERSLLELHIEECQQCKSQLEALIYMRNSMNSRGEDTIKPSSSIKRKIYFKIYRDLLIMFTGLVIIISIVAVSGGLAQMLLFDKLSTGISIIFIAGIILLISGLIVLLYDVFIDMFKILTKR